MPSRSPGSVSSFAIAAAVAGSGADGVIIGSRIVRMIEENLGDPTRMAAQVGDFIREVKAAL